MARIDPRIGERTYNLAYGTFKFANRAHLPEYVSAWSRKRRDRVSRLLDAARPHIRDNTHFHDAIILAYQQDKSFKYKDFVRAGELLRDLIGFETMDVRVWMTAHIPGYLDFCREHTVGSRGNDAIVLHYEWLWLGHLVSELQSGDALFTKV